VNSSLYGHIIQIPKEIIDHLTICFDRVPNSDSTVEGHMRNLDIRRNGQATYQQLGRIKNFFDNYNGNKEDAPYVLNGEDYMKSWVDRTLDSLRNGDQMTKQINQEYKPEEIDQNLVKDLGWLVDLNRPSQEHSSQVDDLKIQESLNRINDLIKKII
jgi:hypothetical protein